MSGSLHYYPSDHSIETLTEQELSLKIARHSPCSVCDCRGLHPPSRHSIILACSVDRTKNPLLNECDCGHDVESHGNTDDIPLGERERRQRVAIRLDELLEDVNKLIDFEYFDDDIVSVKKQMAVIKEPSSPAEAFTPKSLSSLSVVEFGDEGSPHSQFSMTHLSPAKSATPLSVGGQEDEEEEDDDDDDAPLANRMPTSARARIGHKGKTKGGPHPVPSKDFSLHPNNSNSVSHAQAAKDEVRPVHLDKLIGGVAVDSVSSPSTRYIRQDKPCVTELSNGLIRVVSVSSDGSAQSLVILTGLKTLFQKQLPKMPREYISRLVYDHNSKALAIVKNGWKVVGGILFRPFAHRGFAEIVFFATASIDQIKGYGGMLMNYFKMHIKETYPGMMHFLTYADNYAVGYFKKQGFTKDVTLDRSIWAGYIKDYEGATILQCSMLPKVDYSRVKAILTEQREVILAKIREHSKAHIIHSGIFPVGDASEASERDPKDIPGLRETGWSFSMAQTKPPTANTNPKLLLMQQLLTGLQNHPQSWAFLQPVNGEEVSDYYDVIKKPMDFNTMEHKLTHGMYETLGAFVDDARLVFQNCLLYNPEGSVYVKSAVKMGKYLDDQLALLAPTVDLSNESIHI